MKYMRRSPIYLSPKNFNDRPPLVFLTVCSKDRKPILASQQSMNTLVDIWSGSASWRVGKFVLMPDHIHLFCAPQDFSVTLHRWVTFWKGKASINWWNIDHHPLWQRGFWDRQLRSIERYDAKWHYVMHNPVRHGFVNGAEDWP